MENLTEKAVARGSICGDDEILIETTILPSIIAKREANAEHDFGFFSHYNCLFSCILGIIMRYLFLENTNLTRSQNN